MELSENDVFPFGKYKQELIKDVIKKDWKYCRWWYKTIENYTFSDELLKLIVEEKSNELTKVRTSRYGSYTIYEGGIDDYYTQFYDEHF